MHLGLKEILSLPGWHLSICILLENLAIHEFYALRPPPEYTRPVIHIQGTARALHAADLIRRLYPIPHLPEDGNNPIYPIFKLTAMS